MRFRRLKIQLQTSDGPYGVTIDFPDGLVVVWADNSMGKSTCVKSILVALGLEAMLTTTQADLPLPPAVKARLDSTTGEYDVLESEVWLEIENSQGERIVVQRTIKGARDKNLITVYEGPALTSPGSPVQTKDYFVNRQGAATREHGFHHFLAKFCNWPLPLVQTYDGNEYPLYLQCIFPYFIVEQTRGWSTVQPPLPTHFRIRDAHKRAVEFLLDLDAHRVARKRQEIYFEKSKVESSWTAQVQRTDDLAERVAATIQVIPKRPVATWPPQVLPVLVVPVEDEWITIEQRLSKRKAELAQLVQQEIPRVQEIASSARVELIEAEQKVRDKQTYLSRLLDSLEMETQEVQRIEEHLKAIDDDIQKNKDVRTLKQLGSRQGSSVDSGSCPVCHQAIHDSLIPLVAEQAVMSLDENIQFLTEQRRTYEVVLANVRKVVESRTNQVRVMREELSLLRETVRILKQTLVSDGRLPSLAAIRSRLELENAVSKDQETQDQFDKMLGGFVELSHRWQAVQEEIQKLPKDDVTEADKKKIEVWTQLLRDQLTQYGFGSFKVNQVLISSDSYRPEHEGFDLETSFSLQTSISASDLIRTIWSYLHGLLELSRVESMNHPGCIIFDEPRQQSTRDLSFGELLRRAATAGQFDQQVIFFTSENHERLKTHLADLPHTFNSIEGRVLRKL
jgi:hypothetical protein